MSGAVPGGSQKTILIVEDEADLAATLEYNLQREGHRTRVAHDGRTALAELAQDPPPDAVLLDLMLPDLPGTEVCKRMREQERTREVPVLMLTARSAEIDRVVGFEVGADDYVVKPFSVRELMLRLRALLRRTERPAAAADMVVFDRLRVDRESHRVWVDERELQLTALEFRLLFAFISRRGRVQTRDALLSDVWGIEADVTTRTVDTHVKRLREKLGDAGRYIETLRGVGYRFRDQPIAADDAGRGEDPGDPDHGDDDAEP
jgi:two-component system phosphate regulon response regulator PhoB